uniref:Adenine phosphoribosyltransferase n=1 Tax=Candidatus Methanomethylicus mesodigestus TaxID=1867258 RepID=A0A7C3F516_9CREN
MSDATRYENLKKQIRAVEFLRLTKGDCSYMELMRLTGIPITVLNRYVKGHILPSPDRAAAILEKLEKGYDVNRHIMDKVVFDKGGFLDNTKIVGDTLLLRYIADHVVQRLAGRRVSKVLTVAVDGIPLAVHIAAAFGVPFLYAKKEKEIGVTNFLEETYTVSKAGMQISLYIPKGGIERKDSVLITDDVVRSGEQLKALVNLARKSGAEISAVFVLIAVGEKWKKEIDEGANFPIYSIVTLPEKE